MENLILILCVLAAILLGLVVLIQNPKGGGLASGFAGSSQVGGVKRTADFLEKATWWLGGILFVLCVVATSIHSTPREVPAEEQTEQAEGGNQEGQGADQQQNQGGQPAQ
ncbi:MAG: preprotein translocase subunit SecG [Bacteroidota bacterium]|jgi:preprotein translocase subunit SecG